MKAIAVAAVSSVIFFGDPHREALWSLRLACNKKQTSFYERMPTHAQWKKMRVS